MRAFAASVLLALVSVVPTQAQFTHSAQDLCTGLGPCDAPSSASSVPFGYAAEDWSPAYASGRAHLSTIVPTALGSVLLRIHLNRTDDPSTDDPSMGDPSMAIRWALRHSD